MIATYKDLEVYKQSYSLALKIHEITRKYPEFERYEIGNQMRRAAISIPLNIAEGYGKKESVIEFKRFLKISMGSCNEMLVLLDLSKDLGYIKSEQHEELTKCYEIMGKRLNALNQKWK